MWVQAEQLDRRLDPQLWRYLICHPYDNRQWHVDAKLRSRRAILVNLVSKLFLTQEVDKTCTARGLLRSCFHLTRAQPVKQTQAVPNGSAESAVVMWSRMTSQPFCRALTISA